MFLTISTTGDATTPATDLGFLLHKHPDRAQRFSTSGGDAHVFYPESAPDRCTAALLLDVDPVALVRRGRGGGGGGAGRGRGPDRSPDPTLAQYVNDRPYAASSLLSVALRTVFATALKGRCDAKPELPGRALPLRVEVPALPARGGPALVRRLLEPLGWEVEAQALPLDGTFPEWGDSRYVRLVLDGRQRVADALRHLYVLLPVLDDAKHYWIAPDEVDKLLRAGEGWLPAHPEQELITRRYLARRRALTRDAQERLELARLAEADDTEAEELDNAVADEPEETPDGTPDGTPDEARPIPLAVHRREAILSAVAEAGARRVLDLGCGQGQLVQALLKDRRITEVVGVDVSLRALHAAARRLHLDSMPERQAERVRLLQSSLVYGDARLAGYDAAVLSEVVEHVDPPRLPALEQAVFATARPGVVVVTTPNVEYNVRWESLPAGKARHHDHRFEWTRAQFREWAEGVAARHGYTVAFRPVGDDDPEVGPPTQLALFHKGVTTTAEPTPASGQATPAEGRATPAPDPTPASEVPAPTPDRSGQGAGGRETLPAEGRTTTRGAEPDHGGPPGQTSAAGGRIAPGAQPEPPGPSGQRVAGRQKNPAGGRETARRAQDVTGPGGPNPQQGDPR